MKKRIVSLMLVAAMSVSLVACGGKGENNTEVAGGSTEAASGNEFVAPDNAKYTAESTDLYEKVLGEFYEEYQKAFQAKSVSERYALMAVAEAKLLEAGVMMPTTSKGGRYAITHVAPYSGDYVMWGTDENRFHNSLVYAELLKNADRDELRTKWAEMKADTTKTGADYIAFAKDFMAGKGYTQVDSYSYPYTGDPETWDVLGSSRATTNEPLSQCVDGLLEYDALGRLQPALAESYEVSEDGLTYTFHLRKGVQWVNSQGQEICELTAKDFVNGFQHMMDTQSGLGDLEAGVVVGVTEYINGEYTDMSKVGVAATDDYTVVYTLVEPCSYYLTTLEYSAYAPLCTEFYESKGGKFGAEYDATCQYGQTKDDIAYCGPYTCTAATAEKEMVFEANPSYYAPEKRNVSKVTFVFEDGQDPTQVYNHAKEGTVSGCSLTETTLKLAREEGLFDNDNVYVSSTDATSYMAFLNINRYATANTNDTTTVVTTRDAADIAKTTKAFQNVHVRRAICTGLDRKAWNAMKAGDELAEKAIINSYTPGKMFQLEEAVTVNGTEYPVGTYYGKIMQDTLTADGVEITVWKDGVLEDEAGSGYDGWYNPAYAQKELAAAVEELKAEGVEITTDSPLSFDLPYSAADPTYTNLAQAYKQSVEGTFDGLVKVNLVPCNDNNEWYYAGYFTTYGYEANYDVYDLSGWGPDYGDPSTYLNTFLPDYSGYMIKCIGIF